MSFSSSISPTPVVPGRLGGRGFAEGSSTSSYRDVRAGLAKVGWPACGGQPTLTELHGLGHRPSVAARRGLLPAAERSTVGYRLYPHSDVELLTFIRQARALGLHLDDVREMLDIRRSGTPPCEAVRNLLDARIAEIDATVSDLLALRQTIASTRQAADDQPCEDDSAVCSIIEER